MCAKQGPHLEPRGTVTGAPNRLELLFLEKRCDQFPLYYLNAFPVCQLDFDQICQAGELCRLRSKVENGDP
ncbi:MAG: hypothetical protein HN742_30585 [Lentisphaerae bacterium]|nr:hypothetical protein [Lentisphaerota bacterium]MBT4820962.1 hypothetical protein [Lentisphaerota bacterium]MBT5612078.1 hypothetical protein [Lentisphaerota bacterium]MBT7061879.1 hypothetical protein [Lentisphaerota bacterium]MBT7846258.1 hypothetical protein [Lentisphaerota bacterium]